MNVKKIYHNFLIELQTVYDFAEATTIIDWLFEDILKIKKSDLIKNPSQNISAELVKILNSKKNALLHHQPIQYVLGNTLFCKLQFTVNKNVLIPRPETEELVNLIIDDTKLNNKKINLLDIGTGSGCIAITLKKKLQAATVFAIDISEGAITLATKNATDNNTKVVFKTINFLNEETWAQLPKFNIIVSNPPYIPISEKQKMDNNVVQYEPHLALFVPDTDALLFYKKIAKFGKTHLHVYGKIFVETHEDYTKKVAELFSATYKNVFIKKDIFEKERMVVAFN